REEDTAVLIKDGARLTRYTLAQHPFDVVGWDGMVYPYTFNADDFEPITGTVHQPPPVQQTFETSGFVVCTFAPRLLDTHPEAIKVPYAHSNIEADEVLYHVRGPFGSRRGVEAVPVPLNPRVDRGTRGLHIVVAWPPLDEDYRTLVEVVGARPNAWVTTVDAQWRVNLPPFSIFSAYGASPPIVDFSPTLRRDGINKDTLLNI